MNTRKFELNIWCSWYKCLWNASKWAFSVPKFGCCCQSYWRLSLTDNCSKVVFITYFMDSLQPGVLASKSGIKAAAPLLAGGSLLHLKLLG